MAKLIKKNALFINSKIQSSDRKRYSLNFIGEQTKDLELDQWIKSENILYNHWDIKKLKKLADTF